MAIYKNNNANSPIRSVEFMPAAEGNFAFIHVNSLAEKEQVKQWLASADMGQEIVSETQTDKSLVLVTRGSKTRDEFLQASSAQGASLAIDSMKKPFNPWAWRGITSIIGQSLQLLSGFKSFKNGEKPGAKPSGDSAAIIGFATANLIANGINIGFGAQKTEDTYQLLALKKQYNEKFGQYLPEGHAVFDPNEKRADIRKEPEHKSAGQKTNEWIKRNSVSGGEIGLRVAGTLSLIVPPTNLKKAANELRQTGSPAKAFEAARNTNNFTFNVGKWTLLGKIIAFCSKAPDPYNPKPHTWLDTIREKVTFRLSSIVEGGAAVLMAYDRYKNNSILVKGKEQRDWFGVVGNVVFVIGYIVRLFAPFGVREVNTTELSAHITDSLAKMPAEKLPQLLAESAAFLTQSTKGKMHFSDAYAELANDLYRYHGIAVLHRATNAGEHVAGSMPENTLPASSPFAEEKESPKPSIKAEQTTRLNPASMPRHANYQDQIKSEAMAPGLAMANSF